MRPFWRELEVEQFGALDGIERERIGELRPSDEEERLVSRLADGTEVLLRSDWVHDRIGALVAKLDEEDFDLLALLCTGRFDGLSSRHLLIGAGPVVDHSIAALAERARTVGVVLPDAHQKEGFRCEPAKDRHFVLSHASPYEGDRWDEAASEVEGADLIVLHCMGYTEAMRQRLAERTGKPVLLARRMLASAVAQCV